MVPILFRSTRMLMLALAMVLAGVGCQTWPEQYAQGVDQLTVRSKVRNARAQRIDDWPGLRVDSAAQSYLAAAMEADDLTAAKLHAITFLNKTHALALETSRSEIYRLSDDDLASLNAQYFPDDSPMTRSQLVSRYAIASRQMLAEAVTLVQQQPDAASLRDELRELSDEIEKPLKYRGKTKRILTWLPFYLPAKIARDHVQKNGPGCPLFLGGFEQANRYTPPAGDASLLARHAPVFVVEANPQASYEQEVDHIGRVVAVDEDHIRVETSQPVIYSFMRELMIAGRPHKQLVYIAWFPSHPKLSKHDPLAGHIDGLTVRISLDANDKPALVETMANCGCFHGLYPTAQLEEAALQEFGQPDGEMLFALEKPAGRKLNAHIPGLLNQTGDSFKPVIYIAAGWHAIVHVTLDAPPDENVTMHAYDMQPYQQLELLPLPDGRYTSMFYDNGLVRHAQRPEGVYFTPLGMLSAGQPRQRETQLIYWDSYDFDAPDLLPRLLRLPSSF